MPEQGGADNQGQRDRASLTSTTVAPEVLAERIAALETRLIDLLRAERALRLSERADDQEAIRKAEQATNAARLALRDEAEGWKSDHNNLINQLEAQGQRHSEDLLRLVGEFSPKAVLEAMDAKHAVDIARIEKFQNRIAGGLVVVAAIGITNIVKVWGG
jgi:hypothetical protein